MIIISKPEYSLQRSIIHPIFMIIPIKEKNQSPPDLNATPSSLRRSLSTPSLRFSSLMTDKIQLPIKTIFRISIPAPILWRGGRGGVKTMQTYDKNIDYFKKKSLYQFKYIKIKLPWISLKDLLYLKEIRYECFAIYPELQQKMFEFISQNYAKT